MGGGHRVLRVACRQRRAGSAPRAIAAVLVLSTISVVTAMASFEPTVSAKEAEVLAKAADVGTTNVVAAIALLQDEDLAETSAAVDFAIGNVLFQSDQLKPAAVSYQAAIAKLPTFRNARKNLGRVYLLDDKATASTAICQALVEEGMADADVYLLLGHGLALGEHWVASETAYRQVLLLKSDSDDAMSGLTRCLVQQERYREARSLLRTMLESDPDRQDLWSLLANVDIALEENGDAIQVLETARRLDCCDATMLGLLGDLYLNTGRAAEAVASYEAADSAGLQDPARMLRAVEGLILIGEKAGAAAILDGLEGSKDILSTPALKRRQLRLSSELAAAQGDTKGAIALLRELIKQDPLDGKALLRLGEHLQSEGDLGAAELNYERAGRLEGMQAEALVHRAQLAVERERFDDAVDLLEAAEAIESRPHVARYLSQVRRLAER